MSSPHSQLNLEKVEEPERALTFYREMLRIRLVEEEIASRYADQNMRCPVHLSIGQEAAAVGMCSVLDANDQVVSNHRCHGHYLAKGGNLRAMLAELHGKTTGCCKGRGGSMHLFDVDAGILASVPIVGSSIPLAVGAALAAKQKKDGSVCVIFLGDGSLEEGVFHESVNFAALHKLPVIFMVENNYYSVYTPLQMRQPARPLANVAFAHGLSAECADGNDVLSVARVAEKVVSKARACSSPGFIVVDTYRWREHCGPNYDNDLGYRDTTEFEEWRSRCPVETFAKYLELQRILNTKIKAKMVREIEDEIQSAFSFALKSPLPQATTGIDHVYAD